jgi:hypothetical protein
MRRHDAARRSLLLNGLERVFEAALAAGRLEPALGALKAECTVSGIEWRNARLSPAQRADAAEFEAEAIAEAAGANGPSGEGKL